LHAQRVRRLIPRGASGVVSVLEALAESRAPVIVIGEVAGALQGWPLVLGTDTVEVCHKGKGCDERGCDERRARPPGG